MQSVSRAIRGGATRGCRLNSRPCRVQTVTVSVLLGAAISFGPYASRPESSERHASAQTPIETSLSGIEIDKSFPQDIIAKWGPPTRIEDNAVPADGVGSLSYSWDESGVRLQAVVVYYTKNGQRCESPIDTVRVWGAHATPDGSAEPEGASL
jgi:hypothetical protein